MGMGNWPMAWIFPMAGGICFNGCISPMGSLVTSPMGSLEKHNG